MLLDKRLEIEIPVKNEGREVFKIYDFGNTTRYRASSFDNKEPETIRWISSFGPEDKLLDIGANIGIYSLFAASRGIEVTAIEPDALNYALLNLHIRLNDYGNKIIPYLIAAHDSSKFSKFNISSYEWGGALNSFDNTLDAWGKSYQPVHSQGVYGISLDEFLPKIEFGPTHIKIDVDGNENIILKGALQTLQSNHMRSLLIELNETRADYSESIKMIEMCGLSLQEKTHAPIFNTGRFSTIFNHIYVK